MGFSSFRSDVKILFFPPTPRAFPHRSSPPVIILIEVATYII
nr:MAG TPA_asm: hypothetical protein [Caudoviricetes sp.]